MNPARAPSVRVQLSITLCTVLIAFEFLRLGLTLRRWTQGEAPDYPGQYESRLLSAITGITLMGAVLVAQSGRYRTPAGRIAYWTLLGGALVALAAQMLTGG